METPAVTLSEHSQGITDCPGFQCAGVACDVRENGQGQLDLALVKSASPCAVAGVFTQNDVCAAPVHLCREMLTPRGVKVAGFVANSGNANACTGEPGMADARAMADHAEQCAGGGLPYLVCSTGRIGRALPVGHLRHGIEAASRALNNSPEDSLAAADAILTSDTRRKVATAHFTHGGATVTVAGMAKGAGMIEPNMATMLAFLVTDLNATNDVLKSVLTSACNRTFNRISIDGDMSTNDTVLLLANGQSGIDPAASPTGLEAFRRAVFLVCDNLAEKIVGDGEKITKLVELIVQGCRSDADAEKVARAIGNSLLVKTSWYGSDPNWGRLADAAGYARIGLEEGKLDIHYDDIPALLNGVPQDANLPDWKKAVAKKRFRITLNLNQGKGAFRLLTSDLSEAYVDFNKSE